MDDENTLSNAQIYDISFFGNENEILIFPFSCFEVKEIKKDKENNNIYRITLGCLGRYREEIKNKLKNIEEFNINIKFTESLISKGIIKYDLINQIWREKDKINININNINICFLLDNNKDLVGQNKNKIFIFSINGKIKQEIEVFNDDILCIIKLEKDKICSSCKDKTIKIIELFQNNIKYKIIKTINLGVSYAKSILNLMNNNIIILKSNNDIDSYDLNNDNNITIYKDETNDIMKFHNNNLVYITAQNNQFILNIIHNKKIFKINIEQKLIQNNQNMICYNNYIFIAFEHHINIFKFTDKITKIELYFETIFKITNIININSNRFILGLLYSKKTNNEEENESIIREYVIHENEKENEINLEIVAEGKFKNIIVEKIIIVNNSKLILKTQENNFIIIEKISKLKKFFKDNNIIKEDEDKDENENLSIEIKNEIKIDGNKINNEKSDELMYEIINENKKYLNYSENNEIKYEIINENKKNLNYAENNEIKYEIKYEIINENKKYLNYAENNEIKYEIINENNNISIKYEEIIESYDILIKEQEDIIKNLDLDIRKIGKQIKELQLNNLPTEISNKVKEKIGLLKKKTCETKILKNEIENLENQRNAIKNANKFQRNALIKKILLVENLPFSNQKEIKTDKTDKTESYGSSSLNSSLKSSIIDNC